MIRAPDGTAGGAAERAVFVACTFFLFEENPRRGTDGARRQPPSLFHLRHSEPTVSRDSARRLLKITWISVVMVDTTSPTPLLLKAQNARSSQPVLSRNIRSEEHTSELKSHSFISY